MNAKSYILAGIIAAISATNAFAVGENTVTSKSYVDAQDALKQDAITTGMVTISDPRGATATLPSLVSYDSTNGLTGNTIGILSSDIVGENNHWWVNALYWSDNAVPTMQLMHQYSADVDEEMSLRQYVIPASGYQGLNGDGAYNTSAADNSLSWLNSVVKGTGLVTRTSTDGQIGERKIFEASDVSGYHAQALTQNEKDIQDISIPTVGAMMSAISSGVTAAAPTGTPNTVANYDANGALGSGIATANAPSYNNGSLTNGTSIATIAAVDTREAKMTCAGWPESVAVADRTDANCWLWQRN